MAEPEFEKAVATLRRRLARESSVALREEPGRLWTLGAEDGFAVELMSEGGELTLAGGGWHDHCQDGEEAADMFMWLLSRRARIVATTYGDREVAWSFDVEGERGWETVSKVGIALPPPFWRRKGRVVRQNRLLE